MYGTPPTRFVLQWPPLGAWLTKKRAVAYHVTDVKLYTYFKTHIKILNL